MLFTLVAPLVLLAIVFAFAIVSVVVIGVFKAVPAAAQWML